MKKRIFILLSTILCALVTVSLVTYSVVDIFKTKKTPSEPENPPIADVSVDSGDLTSDNCLLNMLVGDEYNGSILTAENYNGSLLVVNDNGVLVATTAGEESLSVVNGSVVYSCKIRVFAVGDGSQENPYNIIRPEDLITRVNESNGEFGYYSQQCDLDLSGYASWSPIGSLTNPFVGSYNGNGYKVTGLNISITPENINNYMDNAQVVAGNNGTMLTAGFFGFVGDPSGNSVSEIKDVSIVDAKIDTTEIQKDEIRDSITLTQSYVGVLAGFVINTNISGSTQETLSTVSSVINGSLFADNITSTRGAVSAFIGGAKDSTMAGFKISSKITANDPGVIKQTANGKVYYGGTVVGLLGRSQNTNVQDFEIELDVVAKNYENTIISGAIGYITDTNTENTIQNIKVNNLSVKLNRYSYVDNKAGIIAGAVAGNLNEQCTIKNVSVNNAIVNAIGTGQVSGIIDVNYGIVEDCSVSGLFKGSIVAGVVYANYGTIRYTEDFSELYAVNDVKLVGQTKIGGVAIYNYGQLSGDSNLTQIKATLEWSVVRAKFDENKDNFMMAGIAVVNSGDGAVIENFYTVTFLKDVVNAGGVVGWFEGGKISNIVANTSIRTIAGKVGTQTYSGKSDVVGGIVAIASNSSKQLEITNVSGVVSLNYNVSGTYGVNVYGTVIGKVDANVKITSTDASATIESTINTNYSSENTQYIGYVAGRVVSGSVSVDKNVKVVVAVVSTADNAVIGEINK